MSNGVLHMVCCAVCILSPSASVGQVYPGAWGAQAFAELCVKTAPSLEDARVRIHSVEGDSGRTAGSYNYTRDISDDDGRCICSLTYAILGQPPLDAANDVYVLLEDRFADEFVSGSQDPISMAFEFDGVVMTVEVLSGQSESGSSYLIPQVSREGSCPV